MKRFLLPALLVAILAGVGLMSLTSHSSEPPETETLRLRYKQKDKPSVDHSKFVQLQKHFTAPQQVTEACISCHNGRHEEVMRSSHWNWEREEYIEGRGIRDIGKRNVVNNFCIGVAGSHQSCNKCHIGYGWTNETFDFNDPRNVDCLACHDNSDTYVKATGGAGYPDTSVNLTMVAQHVGKPTRTDCGTCHFFGGGGNNVKHGDLEMALFSPPRTVDVHMGVDGSNMQCVDCHTARKHQMKGKSYSVSSMNRNRVTCEDCHNPMPHQSDVLNEHTYKVACQTCHIPIYAKVNKTKMRWDWSTAGKLVNGKPIEVKDSLGYDTYLSIKGSFAWANNVTPEYIWSNGTATHYLLGDSVTQFPVELNHLDGSYDDPDAKIIPVKIQRSKQPYDPVYRTLIQPKLFGAKPGDGGYWQDFDWNKADSEGMKLVGLPYSGETTFIETEMTLPLNHMVSPKQEAVKCGECHTRNDSRLAGLKDFYMPGRDYSPLIDGIGTLAIVLAFVGTGVHTTARIVTRRRRKENTHS
jgi:octaheme c-type cytochrome (tetrathionate reductase family)